MAYKIHYPLGKMQHRQRTALIAARLNGVILGCIAAMLLTVAFKAVSSVPIPVFDRDQAITWMQNTLLEAGYAP